MKIFTAIILSTLVFTLKAETVLKTYKYEDINSGKTSEFKISTFSALPIYSETFKKIVSGDTVRNGRFICGLSNNLVACSGSSSFQNVPKLKNPVELVAGLEHVCAIDDEGVKCWGANTNKNLDVPDAAKKAKVIAALDFQTCAIANKEVICWGNGSLNDLTPAPKQTDPTNLSLGYGSSICVVDEGEVKCWEEKYRNTQRISDVRVEIKNPDDIVAAYESVTTLKDGNVQVWGNTVCKSQPKVNLVNPKELFNQLFFANDFSAYFSYSSEGGTCARDDEGVKCWICSTGRWIYANLPLKINGRPPQPCTADAYGEWCTSRPDNKPKPFVLNFTNPKSAVMLNDSTLCGIEQNEIICFRRYERIISDYQTKNPKSLVSNGNGGLCVLDDEGVKCWGLGQKQGHYSKPVLKNPKSIISNSKHQVCALDDDGWKCWGEEQHQIYAGDFKAVTMVPNKSYCGLKGSELDCSTAGNFDLDHSKYFHNEKSKPLKHAMNLLQQSTGDNTELLALMYLKEIATEKFVAGMSTETSSLIFNNSQFLKALYDGNSFSVKYAVQFRKSSSLKFVLEIIQNSLNSSKVLLSGNSKDIADKLKLEFSNVLAEDEVTIKQAINLVDLLMKEEVLIKEMSSSHRLQGIKNYYDWASTYIKTGKVD